MGRAAASSTMTFSFSSGPDEWSGAHAAPQTTNTNTTANKRRKNIAVVRISITDQRDSYEEWPETAGNESKESLKWLNPTWLFLCTAGASPSSRARTGRFPERLVAEAKKSGWPLQVRHVFLAKYVSFRDEVTVDDIVRGFANAVRAPRTGRRDQGWTAGRLHHALNRRTCRADVVASLLPEAVVPSSVPNQPSDHAGPGKFRLSARAAWQGSSWSHQGLV